MVSNKELNDRREPGCTVVFADKKYYERGNLFIKRTLRRHEWQSTTQGHLIVPPATYLQRWTNDAAVLQYLSSTTNIPLPRLEATFADDGAFYFCTRYVPSVSMASLRKEQKLAVMKELDQHMATLRSLTSDFPGVPGETLLCPPQRVTRGRWKDNSCWRPREEARGGRYLFCHNDLGQHNVLVDPTSLQIAAIIDWEFAGFWPEWFERPFYERAGPSSALDGEEDDVERCREWLLKYCDEVVMQHSLVQRGDRPEG